MGLDLLTLLVRGGRVSAFQGGRAAEMELMGNVEQGTIVMRCGERESQLCARYSDVERVSSRWAAFLAENFN